MKTMKKKVEGNGTHNSTLSVRVLCVYSGLILRFTFILCVLVFRLVKVCAPITVLVPVEASGGVTDSC